ncbi:hypothetical protein CHU98_g2824 [Xylaria longipes]|nr:hypothetical protein CHU98_g2824 [Xylaria longipes]
MAVVVPNADIASNINHGANTSTIMKHDESLNRRQHSLHAIILRNKSLWQLPRKWTQAHLQALCIDRQSDTSVDNIDRDEDGLSLPALIPELAQDRLKRPFKYMK